MTVKGTVFRYKSDVDTDVIIPARYLNTTSEAELASHCMEDIDKDFVKKVKKGDVLMIIESMKLMNEVQSDFDGVVKEILVENGTAVEFDQPIMIIE